MLRSPSSAATRTSPCPSPPSSSPSQNNFDGASIASAAFSAGMQLASLVGDRSASATCDIDFDSVLSSAAELLEADSPKNADAALSKAFRDFVARRTHSSQIQLGRTAGSKRARSSPTAVNHPQLWSKSLSQSSDASDSRKKHALFMKRFNVRGYNASLLSEQQRTVIGRIEGLIEQTCKQLRGQSSGEGESASLLSSSGKAMSLNFYVAILYRYLIITGRRYTPEQVKDTLFFTSLPSLAVSRRRFRTTTTDRHLCPNI